MVESAEGDWRQDGPAFRMMVEKRDEDLKKIRSVMTVVGGRIVHDEKG